VEYVPLFHRVKVGVRGDERRGREVLKKSLLLDVPGDIDEGD
jgi:hypothetical protein